MYSNCMGAGNIQLTWRKALARAMACDGTWRFTRRFRKLVQAKCYTILKPGTLTSQGVLYLPLSSLLPIVDKSIGFLIMSK